MKTSCLALFGAVALLGASAANASQYAYPSRGQDAATQASDEAYCSSWASQQTHFDPSTAPVTNAAAGAPTASPNAGAALAALGGAIPGGGGGLGGLGGLAGAIPGGGGGLGGLGGLAGAIPGGGGGGFGGLAGLAGVLGPALIHPHAQAQPQAQAVAQAPGLTEYERARAACLTGRGYSVQ
jgi:hypothetical protein